MRTIKKILSVTIVSFLVLGCKTNSFKSVDCLVNVHEVTFIKSLNNAHLATKLLSKEKVLISCGPKTDYFNSPDGKEKFGNAPILLTPVNNKQPFTFTAKVNPQFIETYDAGVIYLFVNDDLWQKFAFEMDERKIKRLVTVRTQGTSDDNNHDAFSEEAVFMKISSDTNSIGFYYSSDSLNWQLVRVYKNNYPEEIWIGISSQSPLGNGCKTVIEGCTLQNTPIKNFRLGI